MAGDREPGWCLRPAITEVLTEAEIPSPCLVYEDRRGNTDWGVAVLPDWCTR